MSDINSVRGPDRKKFSNKDRKCKKIRTSELMLNLNDPICFSEYIFTSKIPLMVSFKMQVQVAL